MKANTIKDIVDILKDLQSRTKSDSISLYLQTDAFFEEEKLMIVAIKGTGIDDIVSHYKKEFFLREIDLLKNPAHLDMVIQEIQHQWIKSRAFKYGPVEGIPND
jgi:hypothetical protein